MRLPGLSLLLLGIVASGALQGQTTLTHAKRLAADVSRDGRIVMDVGGDLWVVPAGGGDAVQLTIGLGTVQRPRWSPDGTAIVFEASEDGRQGLFIYSSASGERRRLSDAAGLARSPSWHPDGERILYSSDRAGNGFDLWETDLPTGLSWRVSDRPGDEIDAAWSANGRDLVYVHRVNDRWSLILRRRGKPEEVLFRADERIAVPSFRPDGSLLTWVQQQGGATRMMMIILAQPRLVRIYEDDEAIDPTPISWRDRQHMVYTANGRLRQRNFDAWSSQPLEFRATVPPPPVVADRRSRPVIDWPNEPEGTLVVHAARLFDGVTAGYRHDRDILIEGGRIVAVEPHADRAGQIVIDLGDLAVLPGFIDADARLPAGLAASHGPDLLATGITTVVGSHDNAAELGELWSGKAIPGPRFLPAADWPLGRTLLPELDPTAAVSASRNTGRVAGTALGSQLRALRQAGLSGEQSLRAIGVNAAGALLADPYLGRIAPGSAADLVLVDGDPLADAEDALNVVAVVRNGRFFSVSGLIDRAKAAEIVE